MLNKSKTGIAWGLQFLAVILMILIESRSQWDSIFFLFCLAFFGYFIHLYQAQFISFKQALWGGIALRLVLFANLPILSDDYFRFIWDGLLWQNHIHPFLHTPQEIINQQLLPATNYHLYLLSHMNSPEYYSVYPTIMQVVFGVTIKIAGTNEWGAVFLMRFLILLAEIGTLFCLKFILQYLKLPFYFAWTYWLNPLVIFELSGNLHFEGVMMFFVAMALFFILQQRIVFSALFFSAAILTKLIPIVLIPLFFFHLGIKKGILWVGSVLIISCAGFAVLFNQELMLHLWSSIHLYFSNFEFNASLFYVLKQFDFPHANMSKAKFWGRLLPLIAGIFIFFLSIHQKKNATAKLEPFFFSKAESILWVYYLFALIVHPWYICFPLWFSVFSRKAYFPVWTFLIFPTYITYRQVPYQESLIWVAIEYSVVFLIFLFQHKKLKAGFPFFAS